MNYEAMAGERITETAETMVRMRRKHGVDITAEFNGQPLIAQENTTAASIVDGYHMEMARKREEYQQSPEGIAAEDRRREYRRAADAAAAEGILPFSKGFTATRRLSLTS